METRTIVFRNPVDKERRIPPALRDEMRPARGLLVGLAVSSIFWLAALVVWLAA